MNDIKFARQYISKSQSSKTRGISFDLSFSQYKKLKSRKVCQYTGLRLTKTTLTIERVDATKGYTVDNCIACHTAINNFKGVSIDDSNNPLTITHLQKMLDFLTKWRSEL